MGNRIRLLYIGNLLSKHGYTPGVVESLGRQLEREGYAVRYAGYHLNRLRRFAEMVWEAFRARRSVDFVLIDTYSTSAFWFAFTIGMIGKVFGLRYIPILHGGDLPTRLKRSKVLCNMLFSNAYQNVAVSGYLHHHFKKEGYQSIIIPNSLEVSTLPFKARKVIKPNLLWVRSFHQHYNPNMAVDVLCWILEEWPNAKLCMIGPDKDGSMEACRSYAEKRNVSEKIVITGRLSKSEWHNVAADYDIFINTTNYDNTPVSVLEAMALGLPIVSTDVGGIPFLLQDGVDALLTAKGDSRAMAERILELLDDQSLVEFLTVNAKSKLYNFDWSNVRVLWNSLLSNGIV